jgi:NADH-quinone oxidoreductase subunit L
MTVPLIILAVLSALGGLLGVPHVLGHALHIPNLLEHWLEPVFRDGMALLPKHEGDHTSIELTLMAVSSVVAVMGILFARSIYGKGMEKADAIAGKLKAGYHLLLNKYYVDEMYHMLVAGPILAASRDFLWKIVDVLAIDGLVNGSARSMGALSGVLRRIQSGVAQNYALIMMVGIVVLIGMVLLP